MLTAGRWPASALPATAAAASSSSHLLTAVGQYVFTSIKSIVHIHDEFLAHSWLRVEDPGFK
jgi:hypothetical protein